MNSATSKILSILLMICAVACLSSIVYHMVNQDYKTETAILSTSDASLTFKGVYIRDEEIINYSGNGAVSYKVSDGGKLGQGSTIAEIYSDESQIDTKQQIEKLNRELEILNKIQNPGTAQAAQPSNLSGLIDERYKSIINSRENNDYKNLRSDKGELLVLLSTYQKVTNNNVDFKERINSLKNQIAELKSAETVPMDVITSDSSAYFVSYADGYEEMFKSDSMGSITAQQIKDTKDSDPVNDPLIIGKLIKGYEWYIAGVIDNRKLEFAPDEKVTVKFQSTAETANGIIYDIKETKDPSQYLIFIKCNELTHDLVQHRTERIEMIKGEYNGIKVPRKAIRFKDIKEVVTNKDTDISETKLVNYKGVYVKLGEQILFKKLDVIYEGSDYVLSKTDAGEGYLALYDDIIVEGVDANGN